MESSTNAFSGVAMECEGIKLIKNTKGYSWEIRVIGLDVPRLEALNLKLIETFGNVSSAGGMPE
jgi:hypothetical protein